jgi:hypothetical protein
LLELEGGQVVWQSIIGCVLEILTMMLVVDCHSCGHMGDLTWYRVYRYFGICGHCNGEEFELWTFSVTKVWDPVLLEKRIAGQISTQGI